MQKSVKIVGAVLVLSVAGTAIAKLKPQQYEPVRNYIVEMRVDSALSKIYQLTANELINDEVIRSAVRGSADGYLHHASREVRETVFEQHQCPVFGLGMYDDVESVCYNARYSEGRTVDNYWYDQLGIPVSIAEQIAEMRAALYAIGRNYLQTPANLKAIHAAKSGVALDEFAKLNSEEKANFTSLVDDAINAFEQYQNNDIAREVHAEYLEAEKEWIASWDSEDRTSIFDLWNEKGQELSGHVTDLRLYLFAARRHAEGGDKLITAYLDILQDLRNRITPQS